MAEKRYMCKCGFAHSKELLDKYVTVATLLILPNNLCNAVHDMFKATTESADLLSIDIKELDGNGPSKLLEKNSMIKKKNFPVKFNYMMRHLVKSKFFKNIIHLSMTHKVLCQVELPDGVKYKSIDIGTTSNGKYEADDKYLINCSMRELYEETGINLEPEHYCPFFQKATRILYKATDLPLYYSNGKTFCYVILL